MNTVMGTNSSTLCDVTCHRCHGQNRFPLKCFMSTHLSSFSGSDKLHQVGWCWGSGIGRLGLVGWCWGSGIGRLGLSGCLSESHHQNLLLDHFHNLMLSENKHTQT